MSGIEQDRREDNSAELPEGTAYFDFYGKIEAYSANRTEEILRNAGERLPSTYAQLGTTLALLELAACCGWGCAKGDHQFERIAGRLHNLAMGAIRVVRIGLYDGALILIRSIGEIGNLLMLFAFDRSHIESRQRATRKERLRTYSPHAVREALKTLGVPIPMEQDAYQLLSEFSAHAIPAMRPNAMNPKGRPVLTEWVQYPGVLTTVNELADVVATATGTLSRLLPIPRHQAERICGEALKLMNLVGGVRLSRLEECLQVSKGKSALIVVMRPVRELEGRVWGDGGHS